MTIKEMLDWLISIGWSQSSLARELGTTQSTVHRIVEKGQGVNYDLGKKIELLHEAQQRDKAA